MSLWFPFRREPPLRFLHTCSDFCNFYCSLLLVPSGILAFTISFSLSSVSARRCAGRDWCPDPSGSRESGASLGLGHGFCNSVLPELMVVARSNNSLSLLGKCQFLTDLVKVARPMASSPVLAAPVPTENLPGLKDIEGLGMIVLHILVVGFFRSLCYPRRRQTSLHCSSSLPSSYSSSFSSSSFSFSDPYSSSEYDTDSDSCCNCSFNVGSWPQSLSRLFFFSRNSAA